MHEGRPSRWMLNIRSPPHVVPFNFSVNIVPSEPGNMLLVYDMSVVDFSTEAETFAEIFHSKTLLSRTCKDFFSWGRFQSVFSI